MPHEVYDMIKPANNQNFPIINAIDVKGGIHYANNLEALNNIKQDKLIYGMLCYVKETNKTYILKPIVKATTGHPDYEYDRDENNAFKFEWQEFCDSKCFIIKGSILSLEVPPDVSTLIIKNDDVEHKTTTEDGDKVNENVYRFITSIRPFVNGQTIKIINMNEEPISISGTIDTPGKAAVPCEIEENGTVKNKYKLVTSYDYNSDNLLRTSFYQDNNGNIIVYYDVDENGKGITKTDNDGNILFDANKYNPEGWFLLPSYDKEEGNWDCRERRIKFLRYDGIINLNKNESITLQHIEGKYWIDIDSNISNKTNDIFESTIVIKDDKGNDVEIKPSYKNVISTQRKLKTIKLNTNCTLIRVSNKNKEIDNINDKNFDEDYFGNRIPCDNYEEGDIITIIPTVDNCSIQLRNNDESIIGSFVGEKHESKIELVKDSINQFVYTKCGTFTGYMLERDKNGNVKYENDKKVRKEQIEDKYVWKKLTSTTVDKPKDVIELDENSLSSKTNYKISIYDNTNIVHMESSYANNNFIRRIKGVNEENLNFYPEFLFVNDIGRDGSNNVGDTRIYSKKVTYTDSDKTKVDSEEIYNIDISNTGLSLTSYSNDKYEEYYYTIPRGLCIKFRYNGKTKKWESIEHFFDKTNTYYTNLDDPTTVTINVKDVMIDHTVAAVPDNSITETMLKDKYVKQWIKGYDTVENEKTIRHEKHGRQYFCWFKDVMVDGRTKNVVFDLSGYKGLTWARNSNEARINGYELPSILQISSIVKKPSSKYELFDGQEITFSMIEDVEMTKPVYFSLHFVHANTAFPISYPNSYYRNMFTLQENNVGYDTLGKYDPNIILKSNETSSSGMFSTNYAIDSNYKNANLDLPLEVPDVIIRTSADYNNSDFYSTNTPLYNTKRSKLSTITFKYNKDRNLWFECRREISPYDCRKVVSLPLYKDNGNTKYLKKSVIIDPETEVLLVNSEFKNINSIIDDPTTNTYKIEAAKHFVTIANINLCNFDFLSYFFLTSKSGRFGTYDSFYKNIQDDTNKDKFIKTEIVKNIFHSEGTIDVNGKTYLYSDGQKDSINRMMKRMHISCLGKKLTVIAINPARLLAFYTSPTYNPSNLTNANNDIFVYSNYGSIMNEKKFSTKAYDPVQALRYVESEILKNEETNDKIKDGSSIFKYQYYNSVIMEDWCWCNSKGLIELKNNKAIDLILQGTNWVPTSEEYSITDQKSINAGDNARAVRWGNTKLDLSNENN